MPESRPQPSTERGTTIDIAVNTNNPWINPVKQAGIPLDISRTFANRYLQMKTLSEDVAIDPLTGLPIEGKSLRNTIATEFSNAIRERSPWGMIFADVDNLKTANYTDKRLGNCVIKYGTAVIANKIEELQLPPEARIFITRATGAADETIVWVFGVTQEKLTEIKESFSEIPGGEKQIINPKTQNSQKVSFSTTTAMITSGDPDVAPLIENAQSYISEDESHIALHEYEEIKRMGDNLVTGKKIVKDLARLTPEELEKSENIKLTISNTTGNTRVSDELQSTILDIIEYDVILRTLPLWAIDTQSEHLIEALQRLEIILPPNFSLKMLSEYEKEKIEYERKKMGQQETSEPEEPLPTPPLLDLIQNFAREYYYQAYLPNTIQKTLIKKQEELRRTSRTNGDHSINSA